MKAKIIVSALLDLSNAFEKSVKKLNIVVNKIFAASIFPRYKPQGLREGSHPLKVLKESIHSISFPLSISRHATSDKL